MPIKTMPIKMIVLSLVVLIAIAGAVAAVPLGGRSGDENNSVLDQDYDDRWVADFPETIGGFNVGYVTTPKDRACSSVPVIYLQSPRASLEEYLSNPPDISLLKAAIHSESGVPSQVTLSFSSRLISKETAAAKNVAWNQDRTDNGCRGPRTDIDDEELSGPSRGFANFKNTDAGRWTNANAQGVKITSPSGIGTAQNVWSSALNNVMTNDNYFLQVGLDFDEARLDLIWTEDEEDLDPQSAEPHMGIMGSVCARLAEVAGSSSGYFPILKPASTLSGQKTRKTLILSTLHNVPYLANTR